MSEPTNGTVKVPNGVRIATTDVLGPSGSIDRLMLAIGIRPLFTVLGVSLGALHCAFAAPGVLEAAVE